METAWKLIKIKSEPPSAEETEKVKTVSERHRGKTRDGDVLS